MSHFSVFLYIYILRMPQFTDTLLYHDTIVGGAIVLAHIDLVILLKQSVFVNVVEANFLNNCPFELIFFFLDAEFECAQPFYW